MLLHYFTNNVFTSHLKSSIHTIRSSPTTNLPQLSATENSPINNPQLGSVSPTNPWFDMRENASIVASLLTRSLDTSPLLRHRSVYSCCLATNEARRCEAMRGDARRCALVTAWLGTEKTPLRLMSHNRGSVFRCYSSCMAQIPHDIMFLRTLKT
jgi:hypothetical protein